MRRSIRCVTVAVAAVLALAGMVGVSVAAPAADAEPAARDYGTPTAAENKTCPYTGQIPVKLPAVASPVGSSVPGTAGFNLPEPSVDSSIYGELCMSEQALRSAREGKPPAVLVLVHGITYGTYYWDFPLQPGTYSAVNALNDHGYATLNIDRVGHGRSDHPLSALTTTAAQAETIHQLIGKLKDGAIGGISFDHVTTVGHSYGSVIAWFESALYNDTDAVIATGYTDRVGAINALPLILTGGPAALDPVTSSEPWAADPGYLQVRQGSRNIPALYHEENADPAVIAKDNELANTVTAPELATFPEPEYDGMHKNITIPTFTVNGEFDTLVCGANQQECSTDASQTASPEELEAASTRLRDWEAPAHNSASCFRAAAIPDAGHDINLHRNAQQAFAQIAYFADQASGTAGENVDSYRASCRTEKPGVSDVLPDTTRLAPPIPIDGVGPLGDPQGIPVG
ncbi:alpha/beta hydrolase [Pseudonocardia endophytica]|uniref:Pimeloyl-ACP methyl ester carboxylesterase n=1 Tax=Pseudonocardia endophytica TaxID=401976 RepID=A0A4R1HEY6_PSEEN|nr:alpha/beta hydrolase [Pseudonocardia endophytica]TCK20684.1 pimeloyl-ACP methyl ester carboxylesterase [Pseudonocardia endophytica]